MANSVFLDTSGWLAILNASDALHQRAHDIWLELGHSRFRVVVTDWVVAETGNGMARSQGKQLFVEEVNRIRNSPNVDYVSMSGDLLDATLDFYRRHQDKAWGLVDCSSFLVMRNHGVSDAFTNDIHFEQAGFNRLLADR